MHESPHQLPPQKLRKGYALRAHQVAALESVLIVLLHRDFDLDVAGLLAGITRPFAAHVTHAAVHCAWLDVVLHVRNLACRVTEMTACRATARAAE